jgi:hypothetical protein
MSFGIGITIGCYWAIWKWALNFKVGPHQEYNIGWAEAVVVELSLHLIFSLDLISSASRCGFTFLVCSDNVGVVSVTNKGWSCSLKTNKILKHIYLLQAQHQIHLKSVHVTSHENISDALSCGTIKEFLTGFPGVNIWASVPLLSHLADKLISW